MNENTKTQVPNKRRRLIAGGAVALAVLAGGAGVAAAQGFPKPGGSHGTTQQGSHDTEHHDVGDKPDVTIKSSVTFKSQSEAAEPANETPAQETAREAAETATLAKVAKVTPTQARDAALKVAPGTIVYEDGAKLPQVSNEDGNVVYDITVRSADRKTETEITVDAGNAKILAQQVDHAEAHEALGD